MTGKWLNISQIEAYLYDEVFKDKLSKNIIVGGSLPDTLSKSATDMVLIDCGSSIKDLNAYGTGKVNLFLYTKSKSNGTKNVKRMSEMETAALECIDNARHPHYVISRYDTFTDYDATHDLHVNVIIINLTVI